MNQELVLKVKRTCPDAKVPEKAHSDDMAWDLFSLEDVTLYPGVTETVSTGICFGIPKGYDMKIREKSGLASQGIHIS